MTQKIALQDHTEIARTRTMSALHDLGADALIATSPANVQYLTGYRSWTHPMHISNQTYALLTAEGKRVLVLPSSDGDFISMGEHHADEIRTFGTFYIEAADPKSTLTEAERHMAVFSAGMVNPLTWVEGLCAAIAAEGLNKATLAVDQGHLMTSYWAGLQENLPKNRLLDAFPMMLRVRSVKTAYEIDMLRQSSACTEAAIESSLGVAAQGATDREIRDAFEHSLIEAGAEHLFSAIGVGTRTCFPNVQPDGTRLEKGGLLRYDAGCRFQGYPSDLARNATLGVAPEKVSRTYQAMLAGEEAAIQHMRPGVLAGEVFEVALETTRKSGVPHYRRHHCGHAIGLDTYEIPIIRPEDRTPLQAGMTFCVETPYYELGLGGIQVEDMVVITDRGAKLLTALSRRLFELAA